VKIDGTYVEARRVLLDALEALAPHRDAVVVVGAQAVYLRIGEGESDEGVAPFTTDGDLAIDPALLVDEPALEWAMRNAGFELDVHPGIWLSGERISVDLIVPASVAGAAGRRGARLGAHGKRAALKAAGLEAALFDREPRSISALDPADTRLVEAQVAGVPSLLIAKAHKLHERVVSDRTSRIHDKDAADVYRLMRASSPEVVGRALRELREHAIAGPSVRVGIEYLLALFTSRRADGVVMASRSFRLAVPEDQIAAVCTAYTRALDDAVAS